MTWKEIVLIFCIAVVLSYFFGLWDVAKHRIGPSRGTQIVIGGIAYTVLTFLLYCALATWHILLGPYIFK